MLEDILVDDIGVVCDEDDDDMGIRRGGVEGAGFDVVCDDDEENDN